MITLPLKKIGDSLGVILPPETLAALQLNEGDTVTLAAGPAAPPPDPHFAEKMARAASLMSRYSNALRELAK